MKRPMWFTRRPGVFDGVLYAQCWEDPEIDRAAFKTRPGDRMFTITSGGCNALAFLLDDPASVVALDLNPHQSHLLELKVVALRALSYDDLLAFMGVTDHRDRLALYAGLRDRLSPSARAFWDAHRREIRRGVIHAGRYERYMRLLGMITRWLVGRTTVERMFATTDPSERERLYDTEWATRRWTWFTRVFLSRRLMTLLFDKAFFAQLERSFSFGDHFRSVVRDALTRLPLRDSTFLSYAFLGRYYDQHHLPPYLRREHIDAIRARLDRLTIVTGDCSAWFRSQPADSIDRFNFTNIFEWMPVTAYHDLLSEAVRVARDGAVMTYRNLLVPRSHPLAFEPLVTGRNGSAHALHERDLSFIYRAYVVEDVHKEPRHGA